MTETSFINPPDCGTCNVYRKKLTLNSVAISDANLKTTTDLDSSYSTYNTSYHYYQIPANGWYEIRLISSATTGITNETCQISNCTVNVGIGVNVLVADSTSIASSSGNGSMYLNGNWSSRDVRDNNTDGTFEPQTVYPGSAPESKKFYLKAGQVVYLRSEANYTFNSATANITAGLNTAELTIIKL